MTCTAYTTRSRAAQRAATPEDLELTGESPIFLPPTLPRRTAVTNSEHDNTHPIEHRRRSYSNVVAKRVPSVEENSDHEKNKNLLTLDEEFNLLRNAHTKLNREQTNTVRAAEDGMTTEEREWTARRLPHARDNARALEPLAEPGDSPSRNKGKGIDP
ncbi:hypothetical protein BDN71DRAFT_1503632 [Pleurotus eryngii]|uniref:Uncharacterized protein n=1 Tax=Pleurotus eryngii TaxID=5323 RepID=A0A9P6A2P4_PLEER|nr:hypothetical protein BDN71DRAFT_1503632 [Pleurotus eryngii]